jgi:hypothetical protein
VALRPRWQPAPRPTPPVHPEDARGLTRTSW